jgi:gluconate transporter
MAFSNWFDAWPALCTVAALAVLLVFIIRWQWNAFVALLTVSLGLGLAAGMAPARILDAMDKGLGDIMRGVAVILALGAMLGRMLDASGAAEVMARTLVRAFGTPRASLAILLSAYLIGIPVLFNVGFLVLIPIIWRLQRETGKSLLYFALPLCFSLGITHSLVPPHPGIVGAVKNMAGAESGRVMVETILFGALMGAPLALLGWLGPGRWWARHQFVEVPARLAPAESNDADAATDPPRFLVCLAIVTMPLVLSLVAFGVKLHSDDLPAWMNAPLWETSLGPEDAVFSVPSVLSWLEFLGHPTMALLAPTGLAFFFLGYRRGMPGVRMARVAGDALQDVGGILFLFGAAGAFKEVIQATGAGDFIARQFAGLALSPVLVCYLVAVLLRMALGSATASILTASAILAQFAARLPGQETLLVLAVANGVTFMTQPADSGFWMVKEYCNLTVRDVMIRFNACRITMSLVGLLILLFYEAWFL